ncbi:hypothetical protein BH09BAC1_BH09BAC1_05510 [soil metagenome]
MKYLLTALVAALLWADNATAQNLVRGPYLQMPTSSSIILRWRTDAPSIGRVNYGSAANALTQQLEETTATTEHEIKITGLQPYTTYYYSVGNGATRLAGGNNQHHFKTSPVIGTVQPIRIWAIGDFGKANQEQIQVRQSFQNYSQGKETDVWIWLGDNAYQDGTDAEYQAKVFDATYGYDSLFRFMPFMPCPGNHDYNLIAPPFSNINPVNHTGAYYDIVNVPTQGEAGGVPSGHELYYSYDYGNVHMIALNSELGSLGSAANDWIGINSMNTFTTSPMLEWLRDDLEANTKPWVIAYFHQPPYTKGSHSSDDAIEIYMKAMRQNYIPVLEEYGVDLVINGHSHVYERSFPIEGHYGNSSSWDAAANLVSPQCGHDQIGEPYVKYTFGPNKNRGTIYAVVGCSASKETGSSLNHPVMCYSAGGDSIIGSFIIEVNGNRLDAHFLRADGALLDSFTIMKVDTTVGIVDVSSPVRDVKVYPNPFSGKTNISYSLATGSTVTLELFDLSGHMWRLQSHTEQPAGEHQFVLDAKKYNLAAGSYIFQVKTQDGNFTQRLLYVE